MPFNSQARPGTAPDPAGSLNQRAEIYKRVATQGATGEPQYEYQYETSRWVSITPLYADESTSAEQLRAGVTHRVRMRFMSNLTAKWQIRVKGRILEVLRVMDPDEKRFVTECLCREMP